MASLETMTDAQVDDLLATTWDEYKATLLSAGFDEQSAQENVDRNKSALYEEGRPNDRQFFFNVVHEGVTVGSLWVASQPSRPTSYFVYDVVIAPGFRGAGIGRAAMEAVEAWVDRRGGHEIELNVFGHNVIARRLYDSLGYETVNVGMRKRIRD